MDLSSRYEIVNTIATGDFATVYRARDRELGREVAVKQIHQQFLADEQQLARYWREAQLLASLQHPNILTIYDIVRPRGWLILELMRGSLRDTAGKEPIDLDFLRVVLVDALNGLQFLHANGITHGDVKPGNLLLDARRRVVLGDFGLARRAANEEGSLLKGTTKYMAPELVAPQFGSVGPASDLYSLGFSAFELMCGPQFESLFPGLATFGRDKQIAWMMWHAAADRNLPEIGRVLQGVPDDLTRVIRKMVVKNQSRRYRSAAEALAELKTDSLTVDAPPPQEDPQAIAAEATAAKRKQRLRLVAIVAVAFSLMLCIAMLLPEESKPPPSAPPEPARGVVRRVSPETNSFVLESIVDGRPEEIGLRPRDRIYINDKGMLLADLRPGDKVTVTIVRDESGRITEVFATRPLINTGRIKELAPDEGTITVVYEEQDGQSAEVLVSVPRGLKITFNAAARLDAHPVTLADLQPDDRVVVHHVGEETGRVATELSVQRVVTTRGVLRDVDLDKGRITVAVGEGEQSRLIELPLAEKCEIAINDRREIGGQLLKPGDLNSGDTVAVAHDVQVVRVDAHRVLGDVGVIRRVQFDARLLGVVLDDVLEGAGRQVMYVIGPQCEITLGGERVTLDDLRDGDLVDVSHDSPGAQRPEALAVAARRPADPSRWAILIGTAGYDDVSLSRLDHPLQDATLLRDVLVSRYRAAPNQAQLLADESLVRLEQELPGMLRKPGPQDSLIVYFSGHAYLEDDGTVYLAPKDFRFAQMKANGLPLQWLVDQLELCQAGAKLLLLDCSHAGDGADLEYQPSTAEMMRTLKAPPGQAVLRTVTAVASCDAGQRGLLLAEQGHGLFAWALGEGLSGKADKNRDTRIEPTELFEYLHAAMTAAAGKLGAQQTPVLFLPDDRPARLSEEAKVAVRRLAANMRQTRINAEVVADQYFNAVELAGGELEPRLLYGLVLLKAKQRDAAAEQFEEIHTEHPELLLPVQGIAWTRIERRSYKTGVNDLIDLVDNVAKPPKPADPYPEQAQRIFYWVGQLREFLGVGPEQVWRPPPELLDALDGAIATRGAQAGELYEKGRSRSRTVAAEFDRRLAESDSNALTAKLKVDRRQLANYVVFPYEYETQRILAGLNQ